MVLNANMYYRITGRIKYVFTARTRKQSRLWPSERVPNMGCHSISGFVYLLSFDFLCLFSLFCSVLFCFALLLLLLFCCVVVCCVVLCWLAVVGWLVGWFVSLSLSLCDGDCNM